MKDFLPLPEKRMLVLERERERERSPETPERLTIELIKVKLYCGTEGQALTDRETDRQLPTDTLSCRVASLCLKRRRGSIEDEKTAHP